MSRAAFILSADTRCRLCKGTGVMRAPQGFGALCKCVETLELQGAEKKGADVDVLGLAERVANIWKKVK